MPRFRFTIRRMMIAVAIAGCISGYGAHLCYRYEEIVAKPETEQLHNSGDAYAVFLAIDLLLPLVAVAFGSIVVWCEANRQ